MYVKGGSPRILNSVLLGTTRNTSYTLGVVISNFSARHTEQFDIKSSNAQAVFFWNFSDCIFVLCNALVLVTRLLKAMKKFFYLFGTPYKWDRSPCYNLGFLAISWLVLNSYGWSVLSVLLFSSIRICAFIRAYMPSADRGQISANTYGRK